MTPEGKQGGGLLKSSAIMFSQDAVVTCLSMVGNLILARWLGPVRLGLFYILNLIPSYSEKFGRLGMVDHAALYFLGKKKYSPAPLFGALTWISLVLATIPLLLVFIFHQKLSISFLKGQVVSPWAIAAILSSVPLIFLYVSWNKLCIGFNRVGTFGAAQISKSFLFILLSLIFWWKGMGIASACVAGLATLAFACAISAQGLIAEVPPSFALPPGLLKDLFGYGWKLYLVTIVLFLHQRLDLLLVAYYCTPAQVSFYSLAGTGAQILWKLPNAVSSLLYVRVAGETPEQGTQTTTKILRVAAWLLFVGGLIGALTAYPFIRSLYGSSFMPVYLPFVLLLPGVWALGLARLLTEHFYGTAEPAWVLKINFVTFLINMLLNLVVIPRYGIAGAALVSTITYTINFILMLIIFRRKSGITLSKVLAFLPQDWRDLWGQLRSYVTRPHPAKAAF